MMAINPRAVGTTRKTLTGAPCKTGIFWSLDAKTGEFLWAKQTIYQNLVQKIDSRGGVTISPEALMTDIDKTYRHCPTHDGGRNWTFSAYNPNSKVMFMQSQQTCANYKARTDRPVSPQYQYNVVTSGYSSSSPTKDLGRIDAVSIETGKTLWTWQTPVTNYTPILSTESGLLFNGGMDRYLRAFDQDTGKVLWQTRLASQVFAAPVTFALNGRQYIAVATGGGYNGATLGLTPQADGIPGNNTVWVFALPQ
jgi:alcohol dehydrogenase (cytochrome c)